jgi:hypothetical protein
MRRESATGGLRRTVLTRTPPNGCRARKFCPLLLKSLAAPVCVMVKVLSGLGLRRIFLRLPATAANPLPLRVQQVLSPGLDRHRALIFSLL